MERVIITTDLKSEQDIVLARQRARQIAGLLGFDRQDQTRIATAVSEITRNAIEYAKGGLVTFALRTDPVHPSPPASGYRGTSAPKQSMLLVRVQDTGPGIKDLDAVLGGSYRSPTGMGLGISGARRLTDEFSIQSNAGQGTTVSLGKLLPLSAPSITPQLLGRIGGELLQAPPHDPLTEVVRQNQELLLALESLRARQAEVERLNRELEDTNRGVVALYTELDEKAGYLQRAAELKTSFLSNMSHEFRTPLNAMLSLSQMLLERCDGELTDEQEKQVSFIRRAANDLSELVNDLLDLARVEAGKVVIRPTEFEVADLFGALRGMLRPLLAYNSAVSLIFDEDDVPAMCSDEGKISQILRNLISNALKFTEQGEITVSARIERDNRVVFTVKDTGIGIAQSDRERIFEEFAQVEGPIQSRVKGTGLGLPLSRKLTELLGGRIWVVSEVGSGSTFQVEIPQRYLGPHEVSIAPALSVKIDPHRMPLLVVEDNADTLFIYDKFLKGTEFQPIPARTLRDAREALGQFRPVAVLLDILLADESTWSFLSELKETPATSDIPVMVATVVDNQAKASALGADAFEVKPLKREWLLTHLRQFAGVAPESTVLIVDDDEISRYLLRGLLASAPVRVIEAGSGASGLALAREERPHAIFVDLMMPEMDGFTTIDRLKADGATRDIPIIVHTASKLDAACTAELLKKCVAILPKQGRTRQEALTALRQSLAAAGIANSSKARSNG